MNPKLIDTHTHVNFQAFTEDALEVIAKTLEKKVWLVNVGTQFDTSRAACELAEQFSDGVYACVGLHPIHVFASHVDEEETSFETRGEEFDFESYKELALRSTKVVAVGEFGLDYYRMPEGVDPEEVKQKQKEVALKHFELAKYLGKPAMIHCRDPLRRSDSEASAYDDLLELLAEHFDGRVNIHSFTGTWEQAKKFLARGYTIGLNGIITFDKTGRTEEVIKNTPLEKILLETDAPYLTPVPHRGKRNEPLFVEYVARKIAEIKEVSREEVMEQTTNNALEFFGI